MEELPPIAAQDDFDPVFLNTLFRMRPGELSPPVRTQFGWHTILLIEVIPARTIAPSDVRTELAEHALLRKRADRFRKNLETLFARTPPVFFDSGLQRLNGAELSFEENQP